MWDCGTYLEAGGGGGRPAEVDIHVVPGRGPADGRVGGPGQGQSQSIYCSADRECYWQR